MERGDVANGRAGAGVDDVERGDMVGCRVGSFVSGNDDAGGGGGGDPSGQ